MLSRDWIAWQTRRWRETGDDERLQSFHRHILEGASPTDALVAAACEEAPTPDPPAVHTAPSRPAPALVPHPNRALTRSLAWSLLAQLALIGVVLWALWPPDPK